MCKEHISAKYQGYVNSYVSELRTPIREGPASSTKHAVGGYDECSCQHELFGERNRHTLLCTNHGYNGQPQAKLIHPNSHSLADHGFKSHRSVW